MIKKYINITKTIEKRKIPKKNSGGRRKDLVELFKNSYAIITGCSMTNRDDMPDPNIEHIVNFYGSRIKLESNPGYLENTRFR